MQISMVYFIQQIMELHLIISTCLSVVVESIKSESRKRVKPPESESESKEI